MAELDTGSVGIKVLAGLPENNGLPAIAAEVLDNPRPVFALVELRPFAEVHKIDTDSHSVTLRMVQIEPLSGAAADALRDQLRTVRESRTGVVPLPGVDGAEVPAARAESGAAAPADDLPVGPEWGDGDVAAEPTPVAAQDTTPTSGVVPPFAAPTPIGKGKRSSG